MAESNALKDKFWQGQIERDTCKMHTVRAHNESLKIPQITRAIFKCRKSRKKCD